jgi:taurine dioxygenase
MSIDLQPLGDGMAAEVTGLELSRPPTAAEADTLLESISEHHVLVFRGHTLTPDQQVAFGRAWGPLETFAPDPTQVAEHPEIFRVSNQPDDGYLDVGRRWHVDNSSLPLPARISMLFSVRIPPEGGKTRFMDMYRAYKTLPDALKKRIDGRTAHHQASGSRSYIGTGRYQPGADQPLVLVHPTTGRKALYLNYNLIRSIDGLDEEEGKQLLAELHAHLEAMPFYSHTWLEGDIVAWDNACTAHMVTPTDPQFHRTLNRLTTTVIQPLVGA